MKRYFVYACEQTYQGFHGIEAYAVYEFSDDWTPKDIFDEYVVEMSYDLMDSYGIPDFDPHDYDSEEDFYEDVECFREENVAGYVATIKEDVTLSTSELDALACELGEREFFHKYCEEEVY